MTQYGRQPAKIFLPSQRAVDAKARSTLLVLPLSTYFAVLLRNYLYAGKPATLSLLDEKPTAQVRQRIPFSSRKKLWSDAEAAATKLGGSVSELIEALIAEDLTSGRAELVIWPTKK